MSSRSKYVQLSICLSTAFRAINNNGASPTLPCNGYVSRIYPPTLTNERVRTLSRRRAQTINIDSIISRIVLTKSYFLANATHPEEREEDETRPLDPAQSPSHRSFPSPVYLVLIFAFFFIDMITLVKVKRWY